MIVSKQQSQPLCHHVDLHRSVCRQTNFAFIPKDQQNHSAGHLHLVIVCCAIQDTKQCLLPVPLPGGLLEKVCLLKHPVTKLRNYFWQNKWKQQRLTDKGHNYSNSSWHASKYKVHKFHQRYILRKLFPVKQT